MSRAVMASHASAGVELGQVLENTPGSAAGRPVRAAFSRLRFLQVSWGGMGLPVRTAARLNPCFQHPAHPLPLENGAAGVVSSLIRSLKP